MNWRPKLLLVDISIDSGVSCRRLSQSIPCVSWLSYLMYCRLPLDLERCGVDRASQKSDLRICSPRQVERKQ